ncbi:MAG TPA: DUF2092 domain-containing protein [Polyangia bacterium]|nr:DUF2092 domain-containing protein [Polyangia bacterium]
MTQRRFAILLGVLASPWGWRADVEAKSAPKVDPAAVAALDKMGAFLRAQRAFTVAAEVTTDDVLPSGQKVKYQGLAELKVRRPDRMRAEINGDRRKQTMFYDGSSFTVHDLDTNYYASFSAPPTLKELAEVAENRYGIDLPLADLFTWGSNQNDAMLKSAVDLGPSTVKGTPCRHYAFRQNDVDWQVWIQDGDAPLPRRLVITTSGERTAPEHDVVMSWNLSAEFPDKVFAFTPPPGSAKIEFTPVPALAGSPKPNPGMTAPAVTP